MDTTWNTIPDTPDSLVTTSRVAAGTVMSKPLATIDHAASLRDAAEQLAAGGIGALVVLRGAGLVGVLSERDVVAHVAVGADLDHLMVGEVMQGEVVTTTSDATVWDAAVAMVRADVRHLPVLLGDQVAGMLSVRDVLASLTGTGPKVRETHDHSPCPVPGPRVDRGSTRSKETKR